MFKNLVFAATMLSSVSIPVSFAETNDDIAALQNMSYTSGAWDEGEIQVKQRRCSIDGSNQDGKYRSFRTYAAGSPSVSYNEADDEFYIYHSYTCRTRTRIVESCGGLQTSTDDTSYTGTIKMTVTVTRNGKVKVNPTKTDLGGHELCGLSLSRTIAEKLDNKNI
jgi:hypothetical protein